MQKFRSNKSLQPKNILGVSKSIRKIRKYAKKSDPSLLPMETDDISTAKQIKSRNPKKFFLVYPTGGVVFIERVYTTRAAARSSSKVVKALIPKNGTAKQSIKESKEI